MNPKTKFIFITGGVLSVVLALMINGGIKAILNFAPLQLQVPEGMAVENVDFTVKLDNLAYHLTMGNV